MEDTANEVQTTLEQPDNDSPVTTNRRKTRPMPVATQEQNGSAIAQEAKVKKERKTGLLPSATTDQKTVTYSGKVIEETSWSLLKGKCIFSVSPDGSHPYLKLSKSSYLDLVTEEPVTGVPLNTNHKVYRIKLI